MNDHMKDVAKTFCFAIGLLCLLVCGMKLGKTIAIRQAELTHITEEGYYIRFGNEIHEYYYEEK